MKELTDKKEIKKILTTTPSIKYKEGYVVLTTDKNIQYKIDINLYYQII